MKTTWLGVAVLLALIAFPGAAQVKKYVTPEGKVIYSDQPVPGAREAGEVAPPVPVSPEAREAVRKATEREAGVLQELDKGADARRAQQERIEKLEAQLELARKELAEGKEPKAGERTGIAGGGSRLNDQYWERQKANEAAVAKAQQELDDARSGR